MISEKVIIKIILRTLRSFWLTLNLKQRRNPRKLPGLMNLPKLFT